MHQQQLSAEAFQRELKGLKVATIADTTKPWPEEAGGAAGLNASLSAGLELLSKFRLQHRQTEHFGMGRLQYGNSDAQWELRISSLAASLSRTGT